MSTVVISVVSVAADDAVYMEDAPLLDEFVLNDVGKVWVGPMGFTRGREWVFGQFDERVLPAAMLVLERTGLPHGDRGDPVRLSRALTKLVTRTFLRDSGRATILTMWFPV